MRPLRFLLAGSVTPLLLLLLPTTALAQTPRAELRDMSCTGIQAAGTDLPERTTLRLTLVDTDDHATLARQDVVTSAAGTFETTVNAQLKQVAGVHMTVQGPGGEELAFADHGMDKTMPMCNLPFTGAGGTTPLLYSGIALVTLGGVAVSLAAWRLRRAAPARQRA
jgi:hypothetical protein